MSESALNFLNLLISNRDDIIYVTVLLSCIAVGKYYRKIADNAEKEKFGNVLGILIIAIVSGFHTFHILISFAVSAGIILLHKQLKCHVIISVFMFMYLLFFRMTAYFGLPSPPGHTNLIQMVLTLKLVGLAFEVNDATQKTRKATKEELEKMPYHERELAEISMKNIFGYSFNYVGVLTGPYITYRTYRDPFVEKYAHDEASFKACDRATIDKFKSIPIFVALYLTTSYFWPLGRIFKDEFYLDQSVLYRLWYVWPAFFIFRMRMYIGLTLSECVCSAAGVGIYPTPFQSTPGGGPRSKDSQQLEGWQKTYDFNTINNSDVYTTETCWTFREAMKSWNMCVQYWLAMNVYKRFPSRKLRTGATLLVSAYWHGVNPGYYFCIFAAPFYVAIEDLCLKRLRAAVKEFPLWLNICVWISKFFAFSYMAIAFQLITFPFIWKFYNSVFHFGYSLWAVQFAVAFFWPKISRALFGGRPRSSEEKTKEEKSS
ncbi:lysophospholipid acyltransferase 7 [Phlebotomus argentipes]|uniref:lysophospholipid acyltransferase 7 n=1 Tax=Phlebotomus argentipes TaxID=94469 RepID=UPI002892CD3E|nr:lysophospholipid acyltransferase 7 [Phlebotomus argentipes]